MVVACRVKQRQPTDIPRSFKWTTKKRCTTCAAEIGLCFVIICIIYDNRKFIEHVTTALQTYRVRNGSLAQQYNELKHGLYTVDKKHWYKVWLFLTTTNGLRGFKQC